jgi:16S rRNA U516 pseudouridylate synthase RsuA-like enzyme
MDWVKSVPTNRILSSEVGIVETDEEECKESKVKEWEKAPKWKEKLYVMVSNTKYSVVKWVSKKFGFKVTWDERKDWDIVWFDTGVTPDKVIKLLDY